MKKETYTEDVKSDEEEERRGGDGLIACNLSV